MSDEPNTYRGVRGLTEREVTLSLFADASERELDFLWDMFASSPAIDPGAVSEACGIYVTIRLLQAEVERLRAALQAQKCGEAVRTNILLTNISNGTVDPSTKDTP